MSSAQEPMTNLADYITEINKIAVPNEGSRHIYRAHRGRLMALYSIDSRGQIREVTYTPHQAEFSLWRSRLTPVQIDAIHVELHDMIDGDEIHTAGWMPGNDWTGTVWEPIYTHACQYDMEASGYCFGLFVWEVMREHPDAWSFGRYEKDGIPIRSLTYFRIRHP